MPEILKEVEKLKILATNKQLHYWEREEAIRAWVTSEIKKLPSPY